MCRNRDSKLISGLAPADPSTPFGPSGEECEGHCGVRKEGGSGLSPGWPGLWMGEANKGQPFTPLAPCTLALPGAEARLSFPTERSSPQSRPRAFAGFLSVLVANKNGGAQVWRLSRPRQHPSVLLAFPLHPLPFSGERPHRVLSHGNPCTC